MTNSRDQLKQALSDIICAPTKRDRPDAAEKVLAAMDDYFYRKDGPVTLRAGDRPPINWGEFPPNPHSYVISSHDVVIPPHFRCTTPKICRQNFDEIWKSRGMCDVDAFCANCRPLVAESYLRHMPTMRPAKDPDVAELLDAVKAHTDWLVATSPNMVCPSAVMLIAAYHKARLKYD